MSTELWAAPFTQNWQIGGSWTASTGVVYDAVSEIADGTKPTSTSDTAYAYKTTDGTGNYIIFDVAQPSTPANSVLTGIYAYAQIVRHDSGSTQQKPAISACVYNDTTGLYDVKVTAAYAQNFTTRQWKASGQVKAYWDEPPTPFLDWPLTGKGGAKTVSESYGIKFADSVVNINPGGVDNRTRFYEAGIIFHYRSVPTVSSFTATAASLSNGSYPTFTWTYADTDSDAQMGLYAITFESASAPTGNPPSEDGSLHAGHFATSVGSWTLPSGGWVPTIGTAYKTYMRAYKYVNGLKFYSDWASTTWTLTTTPPGTPTVTASYDSTDNEVDVTVTTGHNMLTYQNSSVEDSASVGDWASASNITAVTNQSSPAPPTGGGSRILRFTPSGAVTILAICEQTLSVAAGANYYLRADLRGTTAAETCRLGMRWYGKDGSTISTTYGSGSSHSTSAWTSFTATLAAPSTAATANMVIEYQALSSTTDYQYADKIQVCAANKTWAPGTDGATHTLQRSTNQYDWVDVPTGTVTDPSWGVYYVKDLPPRGVTAYYRAKTSAYVGSAYTADSGWSSTVNASVSAGSGWRLQAWDWRGCMKVTRKALTSNVATLTTESPHGLKYGDRVVVFNVDATFNGTFTVTSVPQPTTFTYAKTAGNVTEAVAAGAVYVQQTLADAKVVGHSTEVVESVGIYRPIGSTRPVVVAGDIYGTDGTLGVMATTAAEWATLEAVLTAQSAMMLYDPWGESMLIRIVDRSWQKTGTAQQPLWEASASFVEVAESDLA